MLTSTLRIVCSRRALVMLAVLDAACFLREATLRDVLREASARPAPLLLCHLLPALHGGSSGGCLQVGLPLEDHRTSPNPRVRRRGCHDAPETPRAARVSGPKQPQNVFHQGHVHILLLRRCCVRHATGCARKAVVARADVCGRREPRDDRRGAPALLRCYQDEPLRACFLAVLRPLLAAIKRQGRIACPVPVVAYGPQYLSVNFGCPQISRNKVACLLRDLA